MYGEKPDMLSRMLSIVAAHWYPVASQMEHANFSDSDRLKDYTDGDNRQEQSAKNTGIPVVEYS